MLTFTNPTPAESDSFGHAVTAVGADKVLIGAYLDDTGATNAGAAYLFRTDGTLLTTFAKPAPAHSDYFGYAVAAVGADKVLIGAYQDDTGATDAGAAYLFSTSGTLLTAFTNPTPANFDYFGRSVTAVSTDRVLIGAHYESTGAAIAGAAYLFSTNGALLTTLTNPTPEMGERFGGAVAAVNTDTVLVGAYGYATYTGAAHLFRLNAFAEPLVSVEILAGGNVKLFWPLPATDFVLEETTTFVLPVGANSWSRVPFPYQTNATHISITAACAGNKFFRLHKP